MAFKYAAMTIYFHYLLVLTYEWTFLLTIEEDFSFFRLEAAIRMNLKTRVPKNLGIFEDNIALDLFLVRLEGFTNRCTKNRLQSSLFLSTFWKESWKSCFLEYLSVVAFESLNIIELIDIIGSIFETFKYRTYDSDDQKSASNQGNLQQTTHK